MPELTSEIEASTFQNIPRGTVVNAHTVKVDDLDPDTGQIKKTKSGLGQQITLDWAVDEGEYAGREIRFDNLSLGGKYKDQKTGELRDLNTEPLCKFLTFTGVPWECKNCNNGKKARSFYIATGEDGLVKGRYYCPDCKSKNLRINYNTTEFLGARCGLVLDIQKKTTTAADGTRVVDPDREYNVVKTYLPLKR